MKKKLLIILMLFTMSASLASCGNSEQEVSNPSMSSPSDEANPALSENDPDSGIISDNENEPAKEDEVESTPLDDSQVEIEKTLTDIENYLLDKGVLSGERVQMAAEMVGGVDGFKYKDSIGEIYEYDTSSEAYSKLAAGEAIPLEGMDGYTVTAISVNGKFVLFGNNVPQELIDAFNSFE